MNEIVVHPPIKPGDRLHFLRCVLTYTNCTLSAAQATLDTLVDDQEVVLSFNNRVAYQSFLDDIGKIELSYSELPQT